MEKNCKTNRKASCRILNIETAITLISLYERLTAGMYTVNSKSKKINSVIRIDTAKGRLIHKRIPEITELEISVKGEQVKLEEEMKIISSSVLPYSYEIPGRLMATGNILTGTRIIRGQLIINLSFDVGRFSQPSVKKGAAGCGLDHIIQAAGRTFLKRKPLKSKGFEKVLFTDKQTQNL